jgi:hypothetical protein
LVLIGKAVYTNVLKGFPQISQISQIKILRFSACLNLFSNKTHFGMKLATKHFEKKLLKAH